MKQTVTKKLVTSIVILWVMLMSLHVRAQEQEPVLAFAYEPLTVAENNLAYIWHDSLHTYIVRPDIPVTCSMSGDTLVVNASSPLTNVLCEEEYYICHRIGEDDFIKDMTAYECRSTTDLSSVIYLQGTNEDTRDSYAQPLRILYVSWVESEETYRFKIIFFSRTSDNNDNRKNID